MFRLFYLSLLTNLGGNICTVCSCPKLELNKVWLGPRENGKEMVLDPCWGSKLRKLPVSIWIDHVQFPLRATF